MTESGQLWPSVGASELHLFTWVLKLRVWQRGEKRRGGDKGSILEQEGRGMDRWVQTTERVFIRLATIRSTGEQRAVNRGTDKLQS